MTITEATELREFYTALVESLNLGEVEHVAIALDTAIDHLVKVPARDRSNSLVDL